ncbi:MAG: hypothetical protein GY842_26300 [bacterium]|nr:hypothetical protein [bacterium]
MATHLSLLILTLHLPMATNDNNVEWSGASHHDLYSRTPMCPVGGETFTVSFQTWDFDITSARVYVDDGSPVWITVNYSHDRGPYDVWSAAIPASSPTGSLEYYFELTDGTDTDYLGPAGMSDTAPGSGWTIDFSTISHAPVGATATSDGGAVFKVWAPEPATAAVRGEFNGWGETAMSKSGEHFTAKVGSATLGDMYKYFFSGTDTWKPDARARGLNPSDNYNSHLYDPSTHTWGDGAFETPAFEDMIIYELHVGTFSGRNDGGANHPGTYRDVVDLHLAHLVDLGVNVVELMPINEFPWDWSAGYNPISVWAPEWKWGDPDDLKYLIDTLHQNGIAVLQDIVWNHFAGSDNYLWNYTDNDGGTAHQIYFDGNGTSGHVETPWGSQADFDRADVRDYYHQSIAYWFEEFHFDGYRMDATDFMNSYQGAGWGMMQDMNDLIDSRYVDKIAIAEQLPDDAWVTYPTSSGGAGFDSQWHDNFTDTLRAEILAMAGGNPSVSSVAYVVKGGSYANDPLRVTNYLELHDEAWPDSGGQRMVVSIDTTAPHDDKYAKGRIKLGQGLVMFSAGIPMFLQGSEFLEDTAFGADAPSTYEARLDWTKPTTYAKIFQYFKDIIRLRKTNGGLRANAGCDTYHVDDSAGVEVLAFHRWDLSGNDLVVVANFSNNNHTYYDLGFPQGGTWYEILNSQAGVYDGNGWGNGGSVEANGPAMHGFSQSASLTIPEMGLLVFRHNDPPDPPGTGDFDTDGDTDLKDFAVFQACYDGIDCPGFTDVDLDNDGDVDIADYKQFNDNFTGP